MATNLKEVLSDLKESYEKANKLIKEESKLDPPNEVYRSHYKAKEVLEEMVEKLRSKVKSIDTQKAEDASVEEVDYVFRVILATVSCKLGRIYVFVDDNSAGEYNFNKCLNMLRSIKKQKAAILPYFRALNEIATVYACRQDYKTSFDRLMEGEELYKAYKESDEGDPLTIYDVFGGCEDVEKEAGAKKLEALYTHCTFYLAQVYGHLGELEKSANYCHITLKRELKTKTYEPIDFALNAATLSQYYIGQNMYPEARHHLAAATYIMDENEKNLVTPEMTEEQKTEVAERFKHRYADVARCWAKYGLALLGASKERLFEDDDSENEEGVVKEVEQLNLNREDYHFPGMNLSEYEKRVTDEYCLTFDDAKKVFHFTISCLDKAKLYYTAETEATEYAKIIKDYAQLYTYISFFEEDPKNQCKMHKREAKYYEDLLDLLNPVFYLNICRECWYGAALAYNAIVRIKLDLVKESDEPASQSEIQKINQLSQKCIDYLTKFIESYLGKNAKEIKPTIDTNDKQLILFAYFRLALLHFKLISSDPQVEYENLSTSLKYYTLFCDECAKHPEAAETLRSEIGVSKEIQGLLPSQLANLKKRMEKQ